MTQNTISLNIPDDLSLIYKAACLASKLHRNQLRRDGETPYISHLMRTSLILSRVFKCDDPVIIAAAILHDGIEDCTADYDDIEKSTSTEVAELVAILSKDKRIPESLREKTYDAQLSNAPWQARLIKIADVYDNLCDSVMSGVRTSYNEMIQRVSKLAAGTPELDYALNKLLELCPREVRSGQDRISPS